MKNKRVHYSLFSPAFFIYHQCCSFIRLVLYLTQTSISRRVPKVSLAVASGILFELMVLPGFAHTRDRMKPMSSNNHCIYIGTNQVQAIDTVRSLKDGQWTDSTIWSVGRVPTLNDVVFLVHTVTIPSGTLAKVQHLLYNFSGHVSFEDANAKLQFYPRFRIKKVISTGLRYYSSTVYNYNNQGLLINYVFHSGSSSFAENGLGSTSTLTYNEQGQLVQIVDPISSTTTQRFDYTSDNNGHIISIQRYDDSANSGTYTLTNTFTLEYSTGKFPVKVTNTSATSPNNSSVEQYTYSNGNVIKMEYSDSNNNPTTMTYNYLATTSPNPYYGLLTGFPNSRAYSVNLVEESGPTYIDTYDSNGYIVKQIKKVPMSAVDNITTFEYELY